MFQRVNIYKLAAVSLILFYFNSFTAINKAIAAKEWEPDNVNIFPNNPTSIDVVVISLSGDWSDSGIPDSSAISIIDNNIYFDVINNSSGNTLTVITPWERRRAVGPLSPGTYSVYTKLVGDIRFTEAYKEVAQFTVTSGSHIDTKYYIDANSGNDNNNGLSPAEPFATIQKAVNTAKNGDIIILAKGIYTGEGNCNIDFFAKEIEIRSTDPNDENIVAETIIDCQEKESAFKFKSNETPNSRVSGLTIINASNSGINCYDYSDPTIYKCNIMYNQRFNGGGGIFCNSYSCPTIRNCKVSNNTVYFNGGGIYCYDNSSPIITNCIISDNISSDSGGGIDISKGELVLSNCTITRNSATQKGGGINIRNLAQVYITNSILWDNIALKGSQITIDTSSLSISYSNIQDGLNSIYKGLNAVYDPNEFFLEWDNDNFDINPLFADPNNNDYHLKSQAGRWDPNTQSWVQDDVTSLCIDTGDPNIPIGLEPFPNGAYINMGAYGGTDKASKSLSDLINFRDYWPFKEGYSWWHSSENYQRFEFEITDHLTINNYDIWRFNYKYEGPLKESECYRVYANGGLYRTSNIEDINNLSDITGKMVYEYPEIICPNEPVYIRDMNMLVFQGTLEEVLELSQTYFPKYSIDKFTSGNYANVLGFAQNLENGTVLMDLYGYHFGPMALGNTIDGNVDIETFVKITKPTADESFNPNQIIKIEAEVIRTTSPVIKMQFFINKFDLIGTDTDGSNGWSTRCKLPDSTNIPLIAKATTESGMIACSEIIYINMP